MKVCPMTVQAYRPTVADGCSIIMQVHRPTAMETLSIITSVSYGTLSSDR